MKNRKKEAENVMPTEANYVCIRFKIKSVAFSHFEYKNPLYMSFIVSSGI
jgi:hypothetical protein